MKTLAELVFLMLIASFLWGGMAWVDQCFGPNLTSEKGKMNIQPFNENEKANPVHSKTDKKIEHKNQDNTDTSYPDDDEDEQVLA